MFSSFENKATQGSENMSYLNKIRSIALTFDFLGNGHLLGEAGDGVLGGKRQNNFWCQRHSRDRGTKNSKRHSMIGSPERVKKLEIVQSFCKIKNIRKITTTGGF